MASDDVYCPAAAADFKADPRAFDHAARAFGAFCSGAVKEGGQPGNLVRNNFAKRIACWKLFYCADVSSHIYHQKEWGALIFIKFVVPLFLAHGHHLVTK